jgi:hypothetical protein
MADLAAFSVTAPASSKQSKAWSSVEYALAFLGFFISSSLLVIALNYFRLQGSLKLWISWEQPDFFRPSPDETLWVRRTIVERAAERGAGYVHSGSHASLPSFLAPIRLHSIFIFP